VSAMESADMKTAAPTSAARKGRSILSILTG
jgi:hypothetical protein